jgi:hypothetical protein
VAELRESGQRARRLGFGEVVGTAGRRRNGAVVLSELRRTTSSCVRKKRSDKEEARPAIEEWCGSDILRLTIGGKWKSKVAHTAARRSGRTVRKWKNGDDGVPTGEGNCVSCRCVVLLRPACNPTGPRVLTRGSRHVGRKMPTTGPHEKLNSDFILKLEFSY